jgi:hypothetical protein
MRQGTAACSSEAVGEATTEAGSAMVATTGTVGTVMAVVTVAVVTVAAVDGRPAAVVMEAVDTVELHASFVRMASRSFLCAARIFNVNVFR